MSLEYPCDYYSNADRIRDMGDEELAQFLAEVENRRSVYGGGAVWKCAANVLKWLQRPAEGGGMDGTAD